MKKFKKLALLVLFVFVVSAVLCSCSRLTDIVEEVNESGAYYYDDVPGEAKSSGEATEISLQSTGTPALVAQDRKIIEYIDLSVETKTFDQLMDGINATVQETGGYIESSEIRGNSYQDTDKRTAELTIRIPKTKQADFSDFMSQNSNVVNRSVNTDDVTDQYIDTQSRIKALTLEKETLEKLLSQSTDVSDTLTVYDKLTDVITEIESYQSKLNQMNNLIDYTTFTVYIDEVEKETAVEKQNWFVRTWNNLLDNLSDVGSGLLTFFSFVISALPYWILLGVIALAVILIVRRCTRKKKKAE